MSVIVKGMEMPKNCAYCPLSEYRNTSLGQILDCKRIGTVGSAVKGTRDVLNHRHPNCPLVEIPTPHGRLVDIKSVEDGKFTTVSNEYQRWWNGALDSVVHYAPTVIEAEGSEE